MEYAITVKYTLDEMNEVKRLLVARRNELEGLILDKPEPTLLSILQDEAELVSDMIMKLRAKG